MKQKTIILLLVLFVAITSTKAQEVISSSGNYQETANGSLSSTIGETLTETQTNGNTITQGFQQTNIIVTNITKPEKEQFNISVFPNPTNDYVILKSPKMLNLQIQLSDINGKILFEEKSEKYEVRINMDSYSNGTYYIKVLNNKSVNSFKIIKQ